MILSLFPSGSLRTVSGERRPMRDVAVIGISRPAKLNHALVTAKRDFLYVTAEIR
jgi:hypothetical protein